MENENKWYLVGIKPPNTFGDEEYYYDRWLWIQATDKKDAIQQYFERRKGWLRYDEKPWVTIHCIRKGNGKEFLSPRAWLREQGLI